MSFTTWHNYGYGLCVSELNIDSVEKLYQLLERAPSYKKDFTDWVAECELEDPSFKDLMDFDEDYQNGVATFLKEVISEAEGIELTACDDFDGSTYLLYQPSYPWYLSEKERGLTEEAVASLIREYVSILTDEDLTIDYCSVENGG